MAKLSESIVTNLTTVLKTQMPVLINKITTEYNDGVPFPVIPDKNYYFGQKTMQPEFPCIVIDADLAELDLEMFSNVWAVYRHQINIDIVLQSDDEQVLNRMVMRYARAVWEILYGNQDLTIPGAGAFAISIRPHTGVPSALVGKGLALFKGWRWVLEVHRFDDLS